jgi:CBS domain-containing protein
VTKGEGRLGGGNRRRRAGTPTPGGWREWLQWCYPARTMFVRDLCRRDVDTASYEETALDVARCMRDRQVGTVIVVDDRRPVGIVTDRDLAVRVLAGGLDPQTRVSEVMTPSPTTIQEDATIVIALGYMRAGGFRRLPVVRGDGSLVGIVALDDVLGQMADELAEIGPLLGREAPHRWLGRQT